MSISSINKKEVISLIKLNPSYKEYMKSSKKKFNYYLQGMIHFIKRKMVC